jgi:hypothetical protein
VRTETIHSSERTVQFYNEHEPINSEWNLFILRIIWNTRTCYISKMQRSLVRRSGYRLLPSCCRRWTHISRRAAAHSSITHRTAWCFLRQLFIKISSYG